MTLGEFVENDNYINGCQLLSSYLETKDALNCSLCCRKMLPYRSRLQDLVLCYLPRMSALKKKRLLQLLSEQVCPRTVVVRDHRVIPLFFKWFLTKPSILAVALAPVERPNKVTTTLVAKSISGGAFRHLVSLSLFNLDVSPILEVVTSATCSQLRCLCVEFCHFRNPVSLGIAVACLKTLKRLNVRHCSTSYRLDYSLIACVAIALKVEFERPRLSVLEFQDVRVSLWDTTWLKEAVECGGFNHLEELRLLHTDFQSVGLDLVVDAFSSHSCPHLQLLDIRNCGVDDKLLQATKRLLIEQRLPSLRHLGYTCSNPYNTVLLQQLSLGCGVSLL